jgi:hypothetical protein
MPWEIDHALLVVDKLKRSIYYINEEDKIYIDTALNLSPQIIDWEKSSLPKEFFIEKYKVLDTILKENFIHKPYIFDEDRVYGCLGTAKQSHSPEMDCYIGICPDVDFSEHLLYYLIESSKQVSNKYFVISPQIYKCWDSSWDILVNDKFQDIPYEECIDTDTYKIKHLCLDLDEPSLQPINSFKFAGWFDLYSKNFYETLVPILDEWTGYGAWDLYSMTACDIAKQYKVDVQQYSLNNQVINFYDTGCLRNFEEYGGDGKLKELYKNFLTLKLGRQEQRADIDRNFNSYINQWIKYAKNSNIIK